MWCNRLSIVNSFSSKPQWDKKKKTGFKTVIYIHYIHTFTSKRADCSQMKGTSVVSNRIFNSKNLIGAEKRISLRWLVFNSESVTFVVKITGLGEKENMILNHPVVLKTAGDQNVFWLVYHVSAVMKKIIHGLNVSCLIIFFLLFCLLSSFLFRNNRFQLSPNLSPKRVSQMPFSKASASHYHGIEYVSVRCRINE